MILPRGAAKSSGEKRGWIRESWNRGAPKIGAHAEDCHGVRFGPMRVVLASGFAAFRAITRQRTRDSAEYPTEPAANCGPSPTRRHRCFGTGSARLAH